MIIQYYSGLHIRPFCSKFLIKAFLILFSLLLLTNFSYGQRVKNLRLSRNDTSKFDVRIGQGSPPPLKLQRIKPLNLFQPILVLEGSSQLGLRYVHIPIGWGIESDFNYILTNRTTLEAGFGIYNEEYNEVKITRYPIYVGAKYTLHDLNRILFLNSGIAFSNYFQSISNIETDESPSKHIFGPSFFGEIAISALPNTQMVLRVEEVFILDEKISSESGTNKSLFLRNISVGFRRNL